MKLKIVGLVVNVGIALAVSIGVVRAQNSTGGAGMDAALRGAVERKDVPGVVALVTDRRRVLYQGAFGVADVSTGRALTVDALFSRLQLPIRDAAQRSERALANQRNQ